MSIDEDININLDRYTDYFAKYCETESALHQSANRPQTFCNETIRRVISTAKNKTRLITQRGRIACYTAQNISSQTTRKQPTTELKRSLICTSLSKNLDYKESNKPKMKLQDILKPALPNPESTTNRKQRIEIHGRRFQISDVFKIQQFPSLPQDRRPSKFFTTV